MRKALDGVWEHPAARVEDTPSLPQVEVLLGRLEGCAARAQAPGWPVARPILTGIRPFPSPSGMAACSSIASQGAPLRPCWGP